MSNILTSSPTRMIWDVAASAESATDGIGLNYCESIKDINLLVCFLPLPLSNLELYWPNRLGSRLLLAPLSGATYCSAVTEESA